MSIDPPVVNTEGIEPWKWDDRYDFPRDLVGYGSSSHNPQWPANNKIAVSFVLNYEEGGEHTVLNGDLHSETHIREGGAGGAPKIQERNVQVESEYEYGSRVGVWRIFRLFEKVGWPLTLYAVGLALEKNPAVARESVRLGFDVASHAYRWIDYHSMPAEEEKKMIRKGVECITELCGEAPAGWYYGRGSPRSQALVWEVYREMGLELRWYSDSYADDVPYWVDVPAEKEEEIPKGLLIVPYSYDCNDFRFSVNNGFAGPSDFYEHLKNAFDVLYEEGQNGMPKMMTIGLHCRVVGKPGRFAALKKFVEYIGEKEGVWVTTRTAIADHFRETFPYKKGLLA